MLIPSETEAVCICWPDPDSLPMFYLLGLIPEASTKVAQDEDTGDVEAGLCRGFHWGEGVCTLISRSVRMSEKWIPSVLLAP